MEVPTLLGSLGGENEKADIFAYFEANEVYLTFKYVGPDIMVSNEIGSPVEYIH